MTKKKDLKKRVRARQEETGQRYTAALNDVLAAKEKPQARKPLPMEVIEYADATAAAQRIGLRCRVYIHPALWKGAAESEALTELALRRIHQIAQLDAALGMRAFRRVALEGQLFDLDNRDMGAMLDFYRSTCAGLRGAARAQPRRRAARIRCRASRRPDADAGGGHGDEPREASRGEDAGADSRSVGSARRREDARGVRQAGRAFAMIASSEIALATPWPAQSSARGFRA
jgi:hypothetical protein